VARLDDEEYVQNVAQAAASVKVARARLVEATSVVGATERTFQRITTLAGEGRATEAAKDQAESDMLATQAAVAVAEAGIAQAEAELATARVRLSFCTILADWAGDGSERIIGERLIDSGATISANQPLLRVLDLKPVEAVIHITERTYARIRPNQEATLSTDAWPGVTFPARFDRIAPRFDPASRQAAITLTVDNADSRLKPGMFVRVTLGLSEVADATLIPTMALTRRDGNDVVFVVAEDGASVRKVKVQVGIREGELSQVSGEGITGRVVTLGQQLVADGSAIHISAERTTVERAAPAP
jgi:RND family efflux transporter MFP subunit